MQSLHGHGSCPGKWGCKFTLPGGLPNPRSTRVPLYTRPPEYPAMKKQNEQKTKGHKATDHQASAAPAVKKTEASLDAQ